MSDRPAAHPDTEALYRAIPSIDRLLDAPPLREAMNEVPRSIVVAAAREVLEGYRAEIASHNGDVKPLDDAALAVRTMQEVRRRAAPPLSPAINATGIIIHTNLGRAPMADAAVRAMNAVARGYAPVEMDLATGARGRRTDIIRPLLRELTGAESATVVNNNAAALAIILNTLATGRSVIVSRGELIEIGGSFRLPAVMESGGCVLREVGTTNKTRIGDFEQAIDESTAALLAVHPSNYRVEGFTEAVPIDRLAALGRRHNVPVIHDIGSGLLRRRDHPALANEPDARTSIEAGADLVLFSGDKLLGGPQAGIIAGRADLIAKIEANPLMRSMRIDKLTLAGLGATLQLHRDEEQAVRAIPVLAMMHAPIESLERRARMLIDALGDVSARAEITIERSAAQLGGGALPTEKIESVAIRVKPKDDSMSEEELVSRLRAHDPPVVARTHAGAAWFDLRTIQPKEDGAVARALAGTLMS